MNVQMTNDMITKTGSDGGEWSSSPQQKAALKAFEDAQSEWEFAEIQEYDNREELRQELLQAFDDFTLATQKFFEWSHIQD